MNGGQLKVHGLDAAVQEAIRGRILEGDLRPGDPLVEAQLSAEFGISKTPVREALIALGRDGLVDQVPHHVTRVATPVAADITHACELRGWLEGEIAAERAVKDASDLHSALRKTIRDARAALKADDVHAYTEAVEAFSDVLIQDADNRYAREVIQRLRNILALTANVAQRTAGRRRRSIDEHAKILKAMVGEDPDGTRAAIREHLRSIEKDALAALAALEADAERN
ncbi:MAG: GntR family transcriptional regulator [Actinobacteria bacterium]|nr:GntR family transcriptional regulator [Actinomycetota bacterium]